MGAETMVHIGPFTRRLFAVACLSSGLLLVGCGAAPTGGSAPVPGVATAVPSAARAVGYTTHTFSTADFTSTNVDTGLTYGSGFQWYLTNYYGTQTPANAVTLVADGSITSSYSVRDLGSVGHIPSAPYFVGTAFGCGGYFTAELKFDPTIPNTSNSWPAWWTKSAEHLTGTGSEQWVGEPDGYDHYAEMDIFEFIRGTGAYAATLHDGFGQWGITCPGFCDVSTGHDASTITTPQGTDWNQYHRFGALWVPATAETRGYVKYYFDGVQMGPGFSWTQFTTQAPPPGSSTPWTFGVIDQQHLGLIFGSGASPLTVRSVDVWQGNEACNVTN